MNFYITVPKTWKSQDFETWHSVIKLKSKYNLTLRPKT